MNFTQYKATRYRYNGVSVGKTNGIYFSSQFVDTMGEPKFIKIGWDKKAKAILIQGFEKRDKKNSGLLKLSRYDAKGVPNKHGGTLGVVLNKVLPSGRYELSTKTKEGYILIKK